VSDPDLEIKGGGGAVPRGAASVWFKNKEERTFPWIRHCRGLGARKGAYWRASG